MCVFLLFKLNTDLSLPFRLVYLIFTVPKQNFSEILTGYAFYKNSHINKKKELLKTHVLSYTRNSARSTRSISSARALRWVLTLPIRDLLCKFKMSGFQRIRINLAQKEFNMKQTILESALQAINPLSHN